MKNYKVRVYVDVLADNKSDAIIEARTVFDAQINYTVPKIKSTFKIGGANIGGQEYMVAPGNGSIGAQYYASWTINP